MSELLENPEHWLKRAEEARTIAEGLNDPEARFMMLGVARTYETLAARAKQRAFPKVPQDREPPDPQR
jgi:hypothetical protein